ncbi:MAG TPA: hypothetical protein VKT72_14660 [Candidatus Baltobacteraceae bacterium]|nr:hypothetical protein [Candidatus Baltobacteraceae bacterium]
MEIPNRVPWVNVAVGILTIISPFVAVPDSYGAKWDMVITGFIIGIVAIIEMATFAKTNRMGYWPVINILAGIWLFISTGIVVMNVTLVWSNIVLGVLAIVTALVALSYERMHVTHEVQPPTHTHLRT